MGTSETPISREAVQAKVLEVVKPFVKDTALLETITDKTDLINDLKVNSARFIDILLDLEDAFKIQINDKEADSILTIGDAVRIIMSKQTHN